MCFRVDIVTSLNFFADLRALFVYCKHIMKSADLICAKFLRLSLYTLGWRWWCTVLCVSSGFDLHEAHHVKR